MIIKNFILDFVKNNKTNFIIYFILILIIFPVESIVLPQLYGKIFSLIKSTSFKMSGGFQKISNKLNSLSCKSLIYIVIIIWFIILVCHILKQVLESKIIPKYLSYVRNKMFSNTIKAHDSNYEDLKVGKHISRLLDVSRNFRDCLITVLASFIPLFLGILVINIFFLYINPKIFGISVTGLIISVLILYFVGKKSVNVAMVRENNYLEMSEKISDSFNNLMNIYLNNQNKNEIDKNKEIEGNHTKLYIQQMKLTRILYTSLSVVSVSTFAAIILYLYKLYKSGQINGPKFISIFLVSVYYLGYTIKISDDLPHYLNKVGIIKNSKEFLENILKKNDIKKEKDFIKTGKIEFKNLIFKYPKAESYLFKDFNFTINPFEKIAIIGTSGSGKSSLMKILVGMYKPVSGDILIDGKSIFDADTQYLRSNIIYVNQRTSLFNDSIINNIKYGNNISTIQIRRIINKYKLQNIYSELKNGINTNAGVMGGNLSLGMQKVTILLRSIFKKGKILIFDEPLAGLDKITREKILNMIKTECKFKTVIIITHDKEIFSITNRVVDINKIKNLNK